MTSHAIAPEPNRNTPFAKLPQAEPFDSLIKSAQGFTLELDYDKSTDTREEPRYFPKAPLRRKVSTFHTEGWLWEILSLATACTSLGGFMFLLRQYDNQASPQWPSGLSLNTVVSVISTIFRISVLVPVAAGISQMGWVWLARRERRLDDISCFDAASRGPWGCLRLVYRTKFVHVAGLGAWISIACLALGPFFQQTVKYDQRSAIDSVHVAKTTVAYTYNGARDSTKGGLPTDNTGSAGDMSTWVGAPPSLPNDGGVTVVATDSSTNGKRDLNSNQDDSTTKYYRMPHNLRAAMFNAMFTSNLMSLPDPLFNCPTANCTWDPFGTLGVGTFCANISSEVTLKLDAPIADSSEGYKLVPSNASALTHLLNNTTSQTFMRLGSSPPQANSSFLAPFTRTSGILAVVEWVKVLGRFSNAVPGVGAHITQNSTFEAQRCVFYLAVHELEEAVVNGTYKLQHKREFLEAANATALPSHQGNGTTMYFREPYHDGPPLVYRPDLQKNASNRGKSFTMSQETFDIISSQFTMDPSFLSGEVDVSPNSSLSGPTTVFTLFQADNVTRAMHNLADYMTKSFRANNSLLLQAEHKDATLIAQNQAISGHAWSPQQVVHIQWRWLVLPIIVLLLAAAFLCVVILTSAAHGVGAWKDSPLTLFFHVASGDRDASDNTRSLDTADAMHKAASTLRARIVKNDRSTIEID